MAAFTQAQLDALIDAIAKGVLEIKYQDRVIRYRTLTEMLTLKNEIEKDLGIKSKGGRLLAQTSKGLC